MFCVTCNKDLAACDCPNKQQRLKEASESPYVAFKWCAACDLSYHDCKCTEPVFMMRRGGKLEPLPEAYR